MYIFSYNSLMMFEYFIFFCCPKNLFYRFVLKVLTVHESMLYKTMIMYYSDQYSVSQALQYLNQGFISPVSYYMIVSSLGLI